MVHTEFLSWAPDPKLKSPAGMGKTFESTMGSDIGSVGISWADSRRIALNMATSSLATHCSITWSKKSYLINPPKQGELKKLQVGVC